MELRCSWRLSLHSAISLNEYCLPVVLRQSCVARILQLQLGYHPSCECTALC